MTLKQNEQLVLEAVQSMLQQDAKLGLSIHNDDHKSTGPSERGYEYLHNQIDEMFHLKAAEFTYSEGVCAAFTKVHSYKWIDDPSFTTAMKKEMTAQGIPKEEREKALAIVPKIMEEIEIEQNEWTEKDAGFNPNMREIRETSQPEQPLDFNIEEADGWPTIANVTWDKNNASPSRTPSK